MLLSVAVEMRDYLQASSRGAYQEITLARGFQLFRKDHASLYPCG